MTEKNALEYAIQIIESYEMDIRNWNKGSLLNEGFCQGKIYKNALNSIQKRRENKNV